MSERTNHLDAVDDLEGATLSRRSFLVGAGAAGALTMLGLAGCAPSTSASGDAAASASADAAEPAAGGEGGGGGAAGPAMGGGAADPTWRTDPGASSFDPKETRDFDVVVLGAGHAGVACAHKAAELGKKVVLVEKQAEENYQNLGNENGHINSEWQKSHGVPEVDPMTFFNNWQLNSGNRAEPDILSYFCHHSGEVFDWHLSFTPGYDPICETWDDIPDEWTPQLGSFYSWPGAANHQAEIEGATYAGITQVNYNAIQAAISNDGMEMLWGYEAVYLVKDGDKVVGAIVEGDDGQIQLNASVGVVVATGDMSTNTTMCGELLTEISDLNPTSDGFSGMGQDGMGQKMMYWAGGEFEIGPRAAMGGANVSPMGPWQGTHVLLLDKDGYRFSNEAFSTSFLAGIPGARREAGFVSVFDSNWRATVNRMPIGHLNVKWWDDQEGHFGAKYWDNDFTADHADSGAEGFQTSEAEHGAFTCYCSNDLATLAGYCGYEGEAAERFVASVERYNEMCEQGADTDYAKPAEVLNKLEPPYFAIPFPTDGNMAGGLVTLTGMFCDRHGQVRAQNTFAPIEGLYAAGNCMGGRFPLQYTSPINGVSIGFAQTSGYLVGEYLGGK